jgi:hypothetical protein
MTGLPRFDHIRLLSIDGNGADGWSRPVCAAVMAKRAEMRGRDPHRACRTNPSQSARIRKIEVYRTSR